ncbi:hypothetical protein Bca101_083806 [Brassica carinata]
MAKRDLASGSCSEMRKKLKLDDEYEEVVGDNLSSLAEKEKESVNALVKSFIRSGINPNIIKSPSFAKFIRLLNPDFRPTVSVLEKEALEIHEERKEKAKEFLKGFQGKLTLSYERMVLGHGWTIYSVKGPVLHEGFVCVTAHFVDDDWKVRKWILGYTTNEEEEVYGYAFRNAVQGFEIEGKVSILLLPNDEGFDEETLGGFRRGLEERGTPPVFLVYCCADLFRLMVDDVFNELSESLLEDQAVDMKLEDAFAKDEIYDEYDKPSDEEWIKIQTFSRLVGCIYKVAVELFEGGDVCQKPICPVAATVDSKEEDENDNDGGEDYDEEQEGEEEDYEDEEEEGYEEGGEKVYDTDSSEEAEREARKTREEKPDACKDFALFQEFLKFEGSSPRELGESELDAYLKEPVMEWNRDFRALEWWREEGGHKYPVLSRVARDILSIPISRATSYDAYVTGKREPPAFVVSLEAKVANAMMCRKRWLRL